MIEAVLVQNNQEGIWKESRPPEGRPEILVYIYIYTPETYQVPGVVGALDLSHL